MPSNELFGLSELANQLGHPADMLLGWEDLRDLYDSDPKEFHRMTGQMPWRNLQNPGKIEYQRKPGEWMTFDEEDYFRDIVPGLMGVKPFAPVYDIQSE